MSEQLQRHVFPTNPLDKLVLLAEVSTLKAQAHRHTDAIHHLHMELAQRLAFHIPQLHFVDKRLGAVHNRLKVVDDIHSEPNQHFVRHLLLGSYQMVQKMHGVDVESDCNSMADVYDHVVDVVERDGYSMADLYDHQSIDSNDERVPCNMRKRTN